MRCGVSYAVVVFGFLLRFFVFAVVVISCEVLGFFLNCLCCHLIYSFYFGIAVLVFCSGFFCPISERWFVVLVYVLGSFWRTREISFSRVYCMECLRYYFYFVIYL